MAESDAEVARQIAMGLLRVVNKINQGRRTPRSFGAGPPMTMLEAEMCFLISHRSGVTGSELSRQLGVTRSAMSQTIAKLKQKGFIVEVPDPSDSKRKKLFVTPAGRRAANAVDDYARTLVSEVLDTSRQELDSYLRLVTKWEAFLDAARDTW